MRGLPRWQEWLPYGLLGGVAVSSVLLPAPELLGDWESSTVFTTFGVRENSLSLAVAPRGNIGGAGYAVLEASRWLMTQFDLHPSLLTMRLPVMLAGAIALIFFFVIAKRWFGPWPALGATALLAANPIFSQHQHELIIAGPSLMAFLIFFERLQALALHRERWRNWLTLSLALVLLLLLYGPGRILAVALLGLWLLRWLVLLWRDKGWTALRLLLLQASVSGVAVAVGLVAAAPSNIRFLGPRMLFPRNSENFLVSESAISPLDTVALNARITIESLVLGGGPNHSGFLEATMSQGRFPLMPLLVVPVVLAGLGLCALRLRYARPRLSSPYTVVLVLAVLTTVPILTSSVFVLDEGGGPSWVSSLSVFRLSYFLIPAYLSVAVTLNWVAVRATWVRMTGACTVIALMFAGGLSIIDSRSDFARQIATRDLSLTGEAGTRQWVEGERQESFPIGATSHLQQHAQYDRWARDVARSIGGTLVPGEVVVVSTAISCFPEAPLRTRSLDFYDVNYHDVFLATYLSNHLPGVHVAFAFLPPAGEALRTLVETEGLYSAPVIETRPGVYDYESFDRGGSRIQSLNGAAPDVVVTTTTSELEFVLTTLQAEKRAYRVVEAMAGCGGSGAIVKS